MEKGEEINEEFADCLVCNSKGSLRIATRYITLPQEGDAILLSLKCSVCGYRATEVYLIGDYELKRIVINVNSENDLNRIVYVYGGSRISIPEFGLQLELKKGDIGFATTVEGVLVRFAEKVETLCSESPSKECAEIISNLNKAMKGNTPFSVVIEKLDSGD